MGQTCLTCITNKTLDFCPTLQCQVCVLPMTLAASIELWAGYELCLGIDVNISGINSSELKKIFPPELKKLNGSCSPPKLTSDPEECPKCFLPMVSDAVGIFGSCFGNSSIRNIAV